MPSQSHLALSQSGEHHYEQSQENPELRDTAYFNQQCEKLPVDEAAKPRNLELAAHMYREMEGDGIGIAHNQCKKETQHDHAYAICVFEVKSESEGMRVPKTVMINPVVVGISEDSVEFPHGCLSALCFQPARIATRREVVVAYYDENSELMVTRFTDMAAVVAQHELLHLMKSQTYVSLILDRSTVDKKAQYFLPSKAQVHALVDAFKQEIAKPPKRLSPNTARSSPASPSMLSDELLARCRVELNQDPTMKKAVSQYFDTHESERCLQVNLHRLMEGDEKDLLPLYLPAPSNSSSRYSQLFSARPSDQMIKQGDERQAASAPHCTSQG